MQESEIKATLRTTSGTAEARRLRRGGKVPCIMYGVEENTIPLAVDRKELEKLLAEARSVFVVDYEQTKQRSVVKDIQYHPVRGDIIHIDLQRIKAGQEISISIPLKFIGDAPGVKAGGIFQEQYSELDVTCLPKYLPDEIEVDISKLEIGDAIHVSDLNLENITVKAEPETTLCSVAVPKKIEEVVPEEEEEEELEEEAEPEVIGKAKKEGEEEEEGQEEKETS
jgi:large subunit ribosomal protein L25